MSVHKDIKRVTTHVLQEMKSQNEKISMLTAEGQELYELSEKIIIDIQNKFKITLEREVNII